MPHIIIPKHRIRGPADRRARDARGEKLDRFWRSQVETRKETGHNMGPFDIRDYHLRKRQRSKER